MNRHDWYRDAIIYEVHVRSFFDSDGDGIGDLAGLTERLDYIEQLGVTALWLLPFYPSPLKDDGYDIAGYTDIHPDYGTLADFRRFLDEAHRRGLKVISELVINHTSDQHPWFQRARQAPRGSMERNFYVWSDTPDRYSRARVLFPEIKDSNWSYDPVAGQYYWHRFYAHQPDLNFHSPQVRRAILDIVDFWLQMGIDGLRLDAVTYLYEREGTNCENLPETHAFLRDLRSHIDRHFQGRMLLAEANLWPEDAIQYFGDGDECHMAFHFPIMPRLFMAVEMEDRQPVVDIIEQTPQLPSGGQWALFLRNHDELTLEMVTDEERDFMYRNFAPELRMRINLGIRRRLAPLLRDDPRKVRLLYALLLSLPGTPIIYYGDEIGMGDNYHLGDRNGVRTPMQWSADRNAGFSRANPQSLFLPVITDPAYHYLSTNVENQENNPSSLLRWFKRLISIRKDYPLFGRGTLEVVPCTNHRVFAFLRHHQDRTLLVVANLSRASRHFHLDLSDHVGSWPVELWGQTQFPPLRQGDAHHYGLSLGPHDFYWLELADEPRRRRRILPEAPARKALAAREDWTEIFEGRLRPVFERHLATFLSRQHWFNPRSCAIDSLEASERTHLRWNGRRTALCLIEVRYLDGSHELYVLPLESNLDSSNGEALPPSPRAIVTDITIESSDHTGRLYDATANPDFTAMLLSFARKGWHIDGLEGTFRGHWLHEFQDISPDEIDALGAHITHTERSHTTLVFGRTLVVKLFRRLQGGLSVDVEMGKFLLEQDFDGAAPFVAHLDYHRGRWEPTTLVTVHEYVEHESNGWDWYCDSATEFLERCSPGVLSKDTDVAPPAPPPPLQAEHLVGYDPFEIVDDPSMADFFEGARHLGRRTASLHRVLASGDPGTPFASERLTTSYERGRYQAARTLMARTFRLLRRRLEHLDDNRPLARWILEHKRDITERFRALIARGIGGLRLRIHGDYHLKEVLRTNSDFVIIDFGGHPWLPLGERRIKRSPLRDVASMMRSFHLAGLITRQRLCERFHIHRHDPAFTHLFFHTQRLYAASASALLDGYLQERSSMDFLPPELEAITTLLDALRLKKAIHQLHHDLERDLDPTVAMIGIATLIGGQH